MIFFKKKLIFVVITLIISGCKLGEQIMENAVSSVKQQDALPQDNEMTLAKSILWPKPYSYTFTKDPFEPLFGKSYNFSEEGDEANLDVKLDLRILGVVTAGDGAFVLLASSRETAIFKEKDKVGEWIVEKIQIDKVTLKKGEKEVVLEIDGHSDNKP